MVTTAFDTCSYDYTLESPHKFTHPMKCKWGMKYYKGNEVVIGKYY